MAPKRGNRDAGVAAASSSSTSTPSSTTPALTKASKTSSNQQPWNQLVYNIYNHYESQTPQRTKLVDAFMAFLVVSGVVQFAYIILAGNYPFNAFVSGFGATVGQFVLTASLRVQTNNASKSEFPSISPERAFADYIVCSLILHFFCVNFIN